MINDIYLDIGSSNSKWKCEGRYFSSGNNEFDINNLPAHRKIWVSNVSHKFFNDSKNELVLVESQRTYKTLKNSYLYPKSLGSDRWLAMIASYEMTKDTGFIVIDIGTAITIDVVDIYGDHRGGLIFPGLEKIKQTFGNFPFKENIDISGIGKTTEDAWSIGAISLLINTINQKTHELKSLFPKSKVFLTGGGFHVFKKYLDFHYDYHKNLVLDGLELFADNVG